jgi:hypothetical protein
MLKKLNSFDFELNGISFLYKHLKMALKSPHLKNYRKSLSKQIDIFIFSLLIIRSGGEIEKDGEILYSMFSNIKKGDSISIFSAGSFGQHVYKKITTTDKTISVAWFDEDYFEYCINGLNVLSPDCIDGSFRQDFIICSFSIRFIEETKRFLQKKGINMSRIITIDVFKIDYTNIIFNLIGEV